MKFTLTILISIIGLTNMSLISNKTQMKNPIESIYNVEIDALDGNALNLNTLKGKKILFVNVASKCGYTPQYKDLQDLHEKYGSNLTVIGVPCNQFGAQEPGSSKEIEEFCKKNYGVTFQMTEKIDVKGSNQHPLYSWLTKKALNGVKDSSVKWNFQKYLIDEKGNLIEVFSSEVDPMDQEIISKL